MENFVRSAMAPDTIVAAVAQNTVWNMRTKLKAIIEENQAQDYIHLKGHQDLTEVYKDYELYLDVYKRQALTGALVGMAGIKLMAPHGGIFVIALTSNALLYLLFILIGAVAVSYTHL